MTTLANVSSDEYTLMRLLRIKDDAHREIFRKRIAALAPYKSAILWPEALPLVPEKRRVKIIHAVKDRRIETITYTRLVVLRNNERARGYRDVDKVIEIDADRTAWFELWWNGFGSYVPIAAYELGQWRDAFFETAFFWKLADAMRYLTDTQPRKFKMW